MSEELQSVSIGNDGLPWPQTMDAQAWAVEFCKLFGTKTIDEALMIGWFANAIENARDSQRWKDEKENAQLKADNESLQAENLSLRKLMIQWGLVWNNEALV
jgi:hypothetical protein